MDITCLKSDGNAVVCLFSPLVMGALLLAIKENLAFCLLAGFVGLAKMGLGLLEHQRREKYNKSGIPFGLHLACTMRMMRMGMSAMIPREAKRSGMANYKRFGGEKALIRGPFVYYYYENQDSVSRVIECTCELAVLFKYLVCRERCSGELAGRCIWMNNRTSFVLLVFCACGFVSTPTGEALLLLTLTPISDE